MLLKLIKDPLVHFLFIAAVFFLLFGLINNNETLNSEALNSEIRAFEAKSTEPRIYISAERIEAIKANYVQRWQREPLPEELDKAIAHYGLNQMYLREARNMGLDIGDQIIDRRLLQKMNYMLDDMAAVREPDEQQLKQLYQQQQDQLKTPARFSLTQRFISTERSDKELAKLLTKQSARIAQGLAPEAERSTLPEQFILATAAQLVQQFGPGFSQRLSALPLQSWSLPLDSALGKHFVFITEYRPESQLSFEQARPELVKIWRKQNEIELKQSFDQKLLTQYTLVLAE
ncbi:peptidyl-prolyl cis-trans isomerase [Agaribacterium haliotis]|uniref:peptidylprolyl isomerase n=1 Tax=Agaribacterium haliotis TaxID=2013869 RepID=UPI000BB54613|nr:peptidylprolyl isomerase [Agaribacterium haliotis]